MRLDPDRVIVEREKNGDWIQVAGYNGPVESHSETGLRSGTDYRFRVYTILDGIESTPSEEASAPVQLFLTRG